MESIERSSLRASWASLLTVLLAITLFLCAREMFGRTVALYALMLFCLDPNFLAHGAFVNTDVGAALTTLCSIYAFYRYVKRPSVARMLVFGIALGLTMTAKFTGVFIVPLLCVIAGLDLWLAKSTNRSSESASARQVGIAIAVASIMSFCWIWAIYHLRFAARPAPLRLNPATADYLQKLTSPLVRTGMLILTRLHLLPEAYIYGLADTKISAGDLPSYFFGRDYLGATHWYFPAAFVIKSTIPFLILLLVTIFVALGRAWRPREMIFLALPPAFLFVLSSSSDLGIGYRHLLPMFPPLYILGAGAAAFLISKNPRYGYVFGALLLWQAVSTVAGRPGLLAYANEAWGGPSKTHLYLSDSNVDWGQQLKAVRLYLQEHPSRPCYFAYFAQGPVDFRDYGIHCQVLPTGSAFWTGLDTMRFGEDPKVSGTLLISDGVIAGADIPGRSNAYSAFASVKPDAVIDRGVYVYNGRFDLAKAAAMYHVHTAQHLAAKHDDAGAVREARLAEQLDPNNPDAHELLGDSFAAAGNRPAAHSEYDAALHASELDPTFQKALLSELQLKRHTSSLQPALPADQEPGAMRAGPAPTVWSSGTRR